MKEKEKRSMQREELARHLETLASQLRAGKIEAGGKSWRVPDRLKVKVSAKEKKGLMEGKISWKWSTLESYEAADREKVVKWKDSLKTVKKRMGNSFKKVLRAVEGGAIPDDSLIAEMVKDSEDFAEFTEPEWQTEMDEYMDHLSNFVIAAREGRLEAVRHELRDLKSRMISCHRDFK